MADLATLSLVGTVAGGLFGAIGSIQQGQAASAAASYQAQVARNNQIIEQQNAGYARQQGQVEAETSGMKTAAIIGQEVAAQGASGIDPTTGSPADVVRSTREVGRLDTLNIVQNAELRARGFDIAASNEAAAAQLYGQQAKQASTAGLLGAGGSILSGATSFATKWSRYQTEGVFE